MKRVVAVVAVLTLIGLAGCRRTARSEQTFRVEPNKLVATELPAAKTITAEYYTSDNVPVTAYLVSADDATKALDAVEKDQKSIAQALALVKTLGESPRQASGKLTSPRTDSSTKYAILFVAEKPTTVTVKTKGE